MTSDPNWFSPEQRELQRLALLTQEMRRLHAWLGLLTGLSVLSVGAVTGLAFWLKTQQYEMERQLPAINIGKADNERVRELEARINGLESQASLLNQNVGLINKQVSKGLPTQLKGIQTDMQQLQTSASQFCKNIK